MPSQTDLSAETEMPTPAEVTSQATNLKPYIFHIGYPRTGTTYLQREVFPRLSDHLLFVSKSCAMFVDRALEIRNPTLLSRMDEARMRRRTVLISQEHMLGDSYRDHPEVAGQIFEIDPEAKIVMCVRVIRADPYRVPKSVHSRCGVALDGQGPPEVPVRIGVFRFEP